MLKIGEAPVHQVLLLILHLVGLPSADVLYQNYGEQRFGTVAYRLSTSCISDKYDSVSRGDLLHHVLGIDALLRPAAKILKI